MPQRIPSHTIILQREGVDVKPPIGKAFNFTDAEIKQIEKLDKEALSKVIAKDDTDESEGTVTLSKTELEKQLSDARNVDRAALEAEIRQQILAENKAVETKPAVEPDVKTVKDTGSKTTTSKAGGQAKADTAADEEI